MSYVYLSAKDLEAKYRAALTKLQNAYDEIAYLRQGGFGEHLDDVLSQLHDAIEVLIAERDADAERHGFTVKAGVGPGDWRFS